MPALRFRALGVPVEVRASFLVLVVAIGLPLHLTPVSMLAWVAVATASVLLHEAGHAAAFVAFGDRPTIMLHGAGGHTTGAHHGVRRMVVVFGAGPVAALLVGLALVLVAPSLPADPFIRRMVDDALFATIGLSLFNLVPLGGLDGRAILDGLVSAATGRPAGTIGWIVGALTTVALAGGAMWLGRIDAAITLVVLASLQWHSVDGLIGRPVGPGSAAALLGLGRAAEAVARADADLERTPTDTDTLLVRAAALGSMTRYAEADAAYGVVLECAPHHAQALAGRSWVHRALGLDESAGHYLDTLLALPPTDGNIVTTQFVCLYHHHRYERALELIRAQLSKPDLMRPTASHLHALEAVVEIALGHADAALRRADALVAARPDDFAIHELGALASVQLGRFDEARERAHRALAGAPNHPELLETLGVVERLSGHPERAYEALLEAATLRPELPRARAELSACFTQLGRHAEATAALDNLPPWWTDEPSLHYARACILAAAGHRDEALDRLARATRIRPGLASIARLDPILVGLFQEETAHDGSLEQDCHLTQDGHVGLSAGRAVTVGS